jgi:hypothetical protein
MQVPPAETLLEHTQIELASHRPFYRRVRQAPVMICNQDRKRSTGPMR